MFIHISPEVDTLGETLSTLKFAERVATVELGAARVNKDTSEVKELKEQIASLKLALARKESESDQTQIPRVITPDKLLRRKSLGVSKSANTRQFQTKHKPSLVDDVNSIEGQSDSASSVDLQGLVGSSPPSWKSPSTDGKEEISEWVDKHEDEITRSNNKSQTQLDKRVSSLKREPASRGGNVVVDKGFEVRKIPYEEDANESDETATSDGSESSNMMWQLNVQVNVPRAAASSNGSSGSSTKLKKSLTKTKSMIPSLIPAPTRRLSLGANSSPGQTSSSRQSSNTVVVKKRQNPKKESEQDQTQIPRALTPDKLLRRKSLGVSKSANTRQFQTKHKPSLVDDVNSIEGQSDSASSVDLQGLVGSSPPSWKSPSTEGKEEISEWVDKHEDEITRDKRVSSMKREPSSRAVESKKINVVDNKGFEVRKIPYEEEANESDETATSDGSESSNMMWQLNVQVNVPRAAASSNGSLGSSTKLKKSLTKTKSMIPSLIPAPTRRLSLGANSSPGQTSSTRQSSNTVVVKKRQNPNK
ncbi:hypothetical protein F2Q69_00060516 [Brassica cretica]|uniref:Kinesin motor domain-containing protein n=1 Tax=Brassica cretica TaxID=69181 RepID=A0A8S9RK14_BRACR|nr:hypothetical protein F2Q69_00060516 [Brassica cretica]